jgi:hypothetical protein
MANVVRKAKRFGQILVHAKRARQRPPDLRDLEAVGQPDPEMIPVRGNEYLRLVAKPPKRNRMDNSVAVALEGIARGANSVIADRIKPAPGPRRIRCVTRGRRHLPLILSISCPCGLVQAIAVRLDFLSWPTNALASSALANGPTITRLDLPNGVR